MIIACPKCKTAFNVNDDRIPPAGSKLRCFKCKEVFVFNPPADSGPLVLVANESKAFCQTVADLLDESGFRTLVVHDGAEALSLVRSRRPSVVILDVALPTMFGFDVCEKVKNDPALSGTKVILLAAIYDKTQYKRAPTSLYGADDYIEKHHIHDRLINLIWKLIPREGAKKGEAPTVTAVAPPPPPTEEVSLKVEADIHKTSGDGFEHEGGAAHEKATRLARIIVSDIALYNQELVMEGIRNNSFYELLKDDIEEGKRLFRQRVPEEIWKKRDYLAESIDAFIQKHSSPA